ncbi:MAG TPA: hypothetical protein VLF59_01170 [Candidatus Saccharimonadales bacterium]|nr:hypothetical protein [Candidatus Saccharimonadales bacterium]
MKKKILGGIAAVLILAGIAGSHTPEAPTSVNLTPTSQSSLAPETTSEDTPTVRPAPTVAPTTSDAASATTPQPKQTPTVPASAPTSNNCNPNYSPCIPNSPTDLDCPDISIQVTVTGTDVYHLDADHDGTGCDSY